MITGAGEGPDRILLHVDMDAFYVAVALRERPDLAATGLPVWAGGDQRGVVLSANYAARAFGVRGGMSSTQARRLCPHGVAVGVDYDMIERVSAGVFAIFSEFTPLVEPVSVDEAFLDVTGARKAVGDPVAIGERIRAMVADEQRITCSVGIGPTKLIAKMASNAAKPDGLREVPAAEVTAFLHPQPVEALWGVGDATAAALHRFGLSSVGDIAHTPKATLQRAFGHHTGTLLADYAWGRDPRRVTAAPPERSIGHETTFSRDTDDADIISAELLRMADKAAFRLRRHRVMCRVVVLSLRFADFTTMTRQTTLSSPVDSTGEVYAAALGLYHKLGLQRARIRRVGVRCERLVDLDESWQQPTLDEPDRGWREAERAADAVIAKFGPAAVQRARLTRPGGKDRRRGAHGRIAG